MAANIDEAFFSRQIYTYGMDTMHKLAASNVLISGLGGLGAEVAKNTILSGVRSVVLHDQKSVTMTDLSSNFYLNEEVLGSNRAEVCVASFDELNPYVEVRSSTADLTSEYLQQFDAVVLCGYAINEETLRIADSCHLLNIKFILAATHGLFGQIFVDFGDNFTVTDPTGMEPVSCLVQSIVEGDGDFHVNISKDERDRGFMAGDLVRFSLEKSTEGAQTWGPYKIEEVDSKGSFTLLKPAVLPKDRCIAMALKIPKILSFKPLNEAIREPEFLINDFSNIGREKILHKAFTSTDLSDLDYARNYFMMQSENQDVHQEFARQLGSQLCPINAMFGGFAAQELFKGLSNKYFPLHQWLYVSALECLPSDRSQLNNQCMPLDCRYDGQIAVFGRAFQEKLSRLRVFLVGSGAIGCEMLKNWAMMGVACSNHGQALVTDMDLIEKSNLSRQFLFRQDDLKQPKSKVAAASSRRMNPNFNVESHQNKFCVETECIYDDAFFDQLDIVVNALDNDAARRYVDERCILFQKPSIDSGTMGTIGNTKVIIPHLTDCYSSEPVPTETSYPLCTIKSFPYTIQHTLHWARELFNDLFVTPMQYVQQYVNNEHYIASVKAKPVLQSFEILSHLNQALVKDRPSCFADCLKWARQKWEEYFANDIKQLVFLFPSDAKTSHGDLFWSASKRFPHALQFDSKNDRHADFVVSAANLFAVMYGIPQVRDRNEMIAAMENIQTPEFTPSREAIIPSTEQEAVAYRKKVALENKNKLNQLVADLPVRNETLLKVAFVPIEFEKDDDTNFHMDFIVAASNLRAECYEIQPADRQKSKLIAGRIIPAIATTTSIVSGLVCLELYKIVQQCRDISLFKDCSLNLAQPRLDFFEPDPAQELDSSNQTKRWTIWDRFVVRDQPTLRQLIESFKKIEGYDIQMIQERTSIIYSLILPVPDQETCLDLTLRDVLERYLKRNIPKGVKTIRLDAQIADADGNLLTMPFIEYKLD